MNKTTSETSIEAKNKRLYEQQQYVAEVSLGHDRDDTDYFKQLIHIRLALLKKYGHKKKVLDLCCGTGDYLFNVHDDLTTGIGVDFSQPMIQQAERRKRDKQIRNIEFIHADAKKVPLDQSSVDLIFSFCALYHIPRVEQVIDEIVRLLRPGGIAILELGNVNSLNTLVCQADTQGAIACHITLKNMRAMIKNAGLEVIDWKSFQILPYWGHYPWWLRPLLHPFWKNLMEKKAGSQMLDAWMANMPIIRWFSFRQMIVCRKRRGRPKQSGKVWNLSEME